MRQSYIRTIHNCAKSIKTISTRQVDFFGIADISSKDIAGKSSNTKLPQDKLVDRYLPLTQARDKLANEERTADVTFGQLRLDKDNTPKFHGQYEPTSEKRLYDTVDIKQLYVPDDVETIHKISSAAQSEPSKQEVDTPGMGNAPYKISEVQPELDIDHVLNILKTSSSALEIFEKYKNTSPVTFHFDHPLCSDELDERSKNKTHERKIEQNVETKLSGRMLDENELDQNIMEASLETNSKPTLSYEHKPYVTPLEELDPMSDEHERRHFEMIKDFDFDKSLEAKYDVPKEEKKPVKASDYLKKVRSQQLEPTAKGLKHRMQESEILYPFQPTIRLDSRGFRNYTYQVPQWKSIRDIEIIEHIKSNIIYNNYDILAINKPYGIASHDEEKSRESIDINSLVKEVAKSMKIDKVYLAHRLDKTTTGVLLFATSQQRANELNKLFKSDQIQKTYWCITRGVPDPEAAIIDIPIGEYVVGNKARSCVVPQNLDKHHQLVKRFREARRAITEYRVLKSTKHAALVEVKPRSGVKHQIRCHMSFGLNRPILGDHKYSHVAKVAPQTLTVPLLNALHLRQQKVRTLPMHLHAKLVVIPGAKANGETLFIHAPLQQYFLNNLKSLKLADDDLSKLSRK